MQTEQQAYEIPGQQLRWRVNQLQQQGFPFQVQPAGGGVYIVIVQQPPQVNPFAYEPVRPRQAWPAWDSAAVLRWAIVCVVAAMLFGTLYMVFAAGQSDQPQQPQPQETKGGIWDWFGSLRLPWEAGDAPAAQATQAQPPAKADGFQWPWDRAMDAAADTAESVQSTVTVVSASILAVLVLLIILALVRRGRR